MMHTQRPISDRLSAAVGLLNLDIEKMSVPESELMDRTYCLDMDYSPTLKKSFPLKLFGVVSDEANIDIIQWLPGGRAFIIYDKKRFATNILPHYFKQSQFTSFTRKLSRWNFVRVNRGPLMGAYYHKLFQQDNRALCRLMTCKRSNMKDLNFTDTSPIVSKPCKPPSIATSIPDGFNRSAEDMISFIMSKHSAEDDSIARQALDERQTCIDLLQMQRCKQACQVLGIPIHPDLQLSQLIGAESSVTNLADNHLNSFTFNDEIRLQAADRARLIAHTQLVERSRSQLDIFTDPLTQSAQLRSALLESISTPYHIKTDSVLSQRDLRKTVSTLPFHKQYFY